MAIDVSKIKGSPSIISRDVIQLDAKTGNIYEAIAIISKRANHINSELREIVQEKLQEYEDANDTLEEIIENPEQSSAAIFFEKLPKPSTIAIEEFLEDKIYYRYQDTPQK